MRDDDDYVAEAAQWLLFTVLFTALLVQVDATDDDPAEQTRLSVILICLNMVPVAVSVTYSLKELNDVLHLEQYLPESLKSRLC